MPTIARSRSTLPPVLGTHFLLRAPARLALKASCTLHLSRPRSTRPTAQLRLHARINTSLHPSLGLISVRSMATAARSDNGKPPLMKRSVVSSFLYKFVEEDGQRKAKIALFQRSGQVRTYP